MIKLFENDFLLFLCSPMVSSLDDVDMTSMRISDIPNHDVTKYFCSYSINPKYVWTYTNIYVLPMSIRTSCLRGWYRLVIGSLFDANSSMSILIWNINFHILPKPEIFVKPIYVPIVRPWGMKSSHILFISFLYQCLGRLNYSLISFFIQSSRKAINYFIVCHFS